MVVKCAKCGTQNRIPDIPNVSAPYQCGNCKMPLEIIWAHDNLARAPDQPHPRSPAQVSKGPAIISIVLLLLASFGRWPYGFYTLLRLVVTGGAIYLAFAAAQFNKTTWIWVMGVTAVLFNPLIPVHLKRSVWQFIDFLAALLFAVTLFTIRGKKKPSLTP